MDMLNGKRYLLVILSIMLSLFVIGFGYLFITDAVSSQALDSSGPLSLPEGKVVKLNSGWSVYRDSSFRDEIELQPKTFIRGEYYFRKVLDTRDMQGDNAFLLNPIYSAYTFYVNGIPIDSSGVPSSTDEVVEMNRSHSVFYSQKSDSLELVLHVSNLTHSYGGSLLNWIAYGRQVDIDEHEHLGKLLDGLIVFLLAGFALLSLFNYFYMRRSTANFYFFYYMMAFILHALFTGRLLAGWLFPTLQGGFVYRIEEVLFLLSMPIVLGIFSLPISERASKAGHKNISINFSAHRGSDVCSAAIFTDYNIADSFIHRACRCSLYFLEIDHSRQRKKNRLCFNACFIRNHVFLYAE